MTSLPLAFHRRYRTRDGKAAEHTGYVTVMCYQRLAEVCAQYLHTGSAVVVEGRLQMREWANARGEKQHSLEVRAPYLDIELVDFVRRIPHEWKYRNGTTKYILKKALESVLQEFLHVQLALADAAPANRVEITAIDQAPQRPAAGRRVSIHVIQRTARIEAGTMPQPHSR